jgi:pimeloyl-ACP methyl ester carboxylesterase
MGRGFSQPSNNNRYTEKEYLAQLTTLVDYLLDDFFPNHKVAVLRKELTVIGHSMGGALSSIFAAQHPDLVKRLILFAPAGIISSLSPFGFIRGCKCMASKMKVNMQRPENQLKAWKADFFHLPESGATSAHVKEVIEESIADLDLMYASNETAFESFWLTLMQFPLLNISTNYLTKIRSCQGRASPLPILLLWGQDDSSISAKDSYPNWVKHFEAMQKSGHFSSKLYPEAKHGFFVEYHEEVARDVTQFLSKDF